MVTSSSRQHNYFLLVVKDFDFCSVTYLLSMTFFSLCDIKTLLENQTYKQVAVFWIMFLSLTGLAHNQLDQVKSIYRVQNTDIKI